MYSVWNGCSPSGHRLALTSLSVDANAIIKDAIPTWRFTFTLIRRELEMDEVHPQSLTMSLTMRGDAR